MAQPRTPELQWNEHMMQPIRHVSTRNRSPKSHDGRLESPLPPSAMGSGSSAASDEDRRDSQSTNGRRSRPSLTASQLQLPPPRQLPSTSKKQAESQSEKTEERHLSNESTTIVWETIHEKPSITSQNSALEQVISSRDVGCAFFIIPMLVLMRV